VAYQTPERVHGQYMVCALYKSCLVLATTTRMYSPYNVVASICLANGSIEESDNGRGNDMSEPSAIVSVLTEFQVFNVTQLLTLGNLSLSMAIDYMRSFSAHAHPLKKKYGRNR
jgi:hypothetical protein